MRQFPKPIEDFANQFVTMQTKRYKADYDPIEKFVKSEVLQDIAIVESVILDFEKCKKKDRLAFVAFLLFRPRND
jgi:hypothetical protein